MATLYSVKYTTPMSTFHNETFIESNNNTDKPECFSERLVLVLVFVLVLVLVLVIVFLRCDLGLGLELGPNTLTWDWPKASPLD